MGLNKWFIKNNNGMPHAGPKKIEVTGLCFVLLIFDGDDTTSGLYI